MWNYEAVIKETNDKLRADGHEPLYAVYPADGVSVADSPLGFVDRGRGKEVESFFTDLQAFLLRRHAGAHRRDRPADRARAGRPVAPTAPPTSIRAARSRWCGRPSRRSFRRR